MLNFFQDMLLFSRNETHGADYKFHLRILYLFQLANALLLITYVVYVQSNVSEIESLQNRRLSAVVTQKNARLANSGGRTEDVRRIKRQVNSVDENYANDGTSPRWVWLSEHTRIEKGTLDKYCETIHQTCADKARKLRGAPGETGKHGAPGRMGQRGPRGEKGARGETGAPGDIGTAGMDGLDGSCSCEFPDVITKEVYVTKLPTTTTTTARTVSTTTIDPNATYVPTTRYTGPPTIGPNRAKKYLRGVGVPTEHAKCQFGHVGAWMRDSNPTSKWAQKYWVMASFASASIHQYANQENLRKQIEETPYFLNYRYAGTGMLVRNGMLYYHRALTAQVLRYDLEKASAEKSEKEISGFAYHDCELENEVREKVQRNCTPEDTAQFLYNIPHNFADFAADENGLWLILHYKNEDKLSILKMDEMSLNTTKAWRTRFALVNETGNAFVIGGVLYGIESATARRTRINYAFDMFENKEYQVNIPWRNPNRNTTMVDYNPLDQRIYFFDNGSLLSAPAGFMDRPGTDWKRLRP